MRPVARGAMLALAALAAAAPGASAAPPSAQALVIGNASYGTLPPLAACDMSANLATAALTRAGFNVKQLANPSNARMGAAITALGDAAAATPGTRAVIYYCGYVAAYGDRVFLLPVAANLDRDTDILTQGIVARLLMSSVVAGEGGAGLVLMDLGERPGVPPPLDSLVRPKDLEHAGLAAASFPATTTAGGAPLAAALADLLRPGEVELGKALRGLAAGQSVGRLHLLALRAPQDPAWLVGGPPAVPVASPTPEPAPISVPVPEPVPASLPPAAAIPAPAAPEFATPNPADRRRLLLALQRLGYFNGRISATFGPDALAAIRRFQRESGEPPTGRLTTAQAARLLEH